MTELNRNNEFGVVIGWLFGGGSVKNDGHYEVYVGFRMRMLLNICESM